MITHTLEHTGDTTVDIKLQYSSNTTAKELDDYVKDVEEDLQNNWDERVKHKYNND